MAAGYGDAGWVQQMRREVNSDSAVLKGIIDAGPGGVASAVAGSAGRTLDAAASGDGRAISDVLAFAGDFVAGGGIKSVGKGVAAARAVAKAARRMPSVLRAGAEVANAAIRARMRTVARITAEGASAALEYSRRAIHAPKILLNRLRPRVSAIEGSAGAGRRSLADAEQLSLFDDATLAGHGRAPMSGDPQAAIPGGSLAYAEQLPLAFQLDLDEALDTFRVQLGPRGRGLGGTAGVGKTDIDGFEGLVLRGASPGAEFSGSLITPLMNRAKGMPDVLRRSAFDAEVDLANQLIASLKRRGLGESATRGRTLELLIEQKVCNVCRSGLGTEAGPGILRQLSDRFPELNIIVRARGTNEVLHVRGGRRL
jgi:hypothetical protein